MASAGPFRAAQLRVVPCKSDARLKGSSLHGLRRREEEENPKRKKGYKKEESFLLILDRSVAMVSPEQPQFSN
jgi:hypothetical protein